MMWNLNSSIQLSLTCILDFWIASILQANPPQLHSNLLYIQRYRWQSRLVAETAYFFTNILSAESFILNIDANALSMDEVEFQNNMESARVILSGLSAESDDTSSQSDKNLIDRAEPTEPKQQGFTTKKHQDPKVQPHFSVGSSEAKLGNKEEASGKDQQTISNVLSTSDLENIGASMLVMEDQVSQIFQDFPYLFSQAGDLTVSNVEELLDNYKQLVFRYVCLSKGMGISIPSPPLTNSHHQSGLVAENVKESEDTEAEGSNYETEKDTDRTDDDPNGLSLPVVEKSESKILQDEALESQSVVND